MPLEDLPQVPGRPCSIASALEIVGDRWSLLAVREIQFGNRRFSEIARNTGAPRDRLTARLNSLVDAGVLERRQYQQSPPRSEYHLTKAGEELAPVLHALLRWGDRWAVDRPPTTLRHHNHVLRATTVWATCGERVREQDLGRVVNVPGWDVAGPLSG
jgi:DNA-binding HxlR family transcriptional regulator